MCCIQAALATVLRSLTAYLKALPRPLPRTMRRSLTAYLKAKCKQLLTEALQALHQRVLSEDKQQLQVAVSAAIAAYRDTLDQKLPGGPASGFCDAGKFKEISQVSFCKALAVSTLVAQVRLFVAARLHKGLTKSD